MMILCKIIKQNSNGVLIEKINSKERKAEYVIENRKHKEIAKFDNLEEAEKFFYAI